MTVIIIDGVKCTINNQGILTSDRSIYNGENIYSFKRNIERSEMIIENEDGTRLYLGERYLGMPSFYTWFDVKKEAGKK